MPLYGPRIPYDVSLHSFLYLCTMYNKMPLAPRRELHDRHAMVTLLQ